MRSLAVDSFLGAEQRAYDERRCRLMTISLALLRQFLI